MGKPFNKADMKAICKGLIRKHGWATVLWYLAGQKAMEETGLRWDQANEAWLAVFNRELEAKYAGAPPQIKAAMTRRNNRNLKEQANERMDHSDCSIPCTNPVPGLA